MEPIVKRCLTAPDEERAIAWGQHSERPQNVPRVNPYDLRLFADWANDETPPDAETIARAGATQYVELRILKRLENLPDLERALPFIALLKHVDRELLQEILGAQSDADLVFERLCEQEWAAERQVSGPDGKAREVAVVDERLRRRLWKYYLEHDRFDPAQVSRLAAYLATLTLTRDLSELDWPLFDATLRALEHDPEKAAEWWDQAERRIISARGDKWLLELTGFLQAERNAAAPLETIFNADSPPESVMRPAVLASYAAALLHTPGGATRESVWSEVLAKADRLPGRGAFKLRVRATCGIVAARIDAGSWPTVQQTLDVWQIVEEIASTRLDADLAASLVAATEAILESQESAARSVPPAPVLPLGSGAALGPETLAFYLSQPFPGRLNPLEQSTAAADHLDEPVIALRRFACTLAARAHRLRGDLEKASIWFSRATDTSVPIDAGHWSDWLPPDDLDARVRLEAIRALYPSRMSVDDALSLATTSERRPGIDSDRLVSLRVMLAGFQQPLDPHTAYAWGNWEWSKGSLPSIEFSLDRETDGFRIQPRCSAHSEIPPFQVSAAANLAASGHVDDALATLHQASSTPAIPPVVQLHVDRALARITLRMRLRDEGERGGGKNLEESLSADDRGLLWALSGFDGLKHQSPIPQPPSFVAATERDVWLHAIWRGCFALDAQRADACAAWMTGTMVGDTESDAMPLHSTARLWHRLLDIQEGAALPAALVFRDAFLKFRNPQSASPIWDADTVKPEEAIVLSVRNAALGLGTAVPTPADPRLMAMRLRVGSRRTADLLFDEGDLLALRLPEPALEILADALKLYEAANDSVGTFITVARIHEIDPSADNLRSVREAYRGFRGSLPLELPTWERIVELAGKPAQEELGQLAPRGWRPWLVRLVGAVAIARRRQGEAADIDTYFASVRGQSGARAGEAIVLPAELHALALRSALQPDQISRGRRLREWLSPWLRRAASILPLLVGLGTLVVGAVIIFTGYQWTADRVLPAALRSTPFDIVGAVLFVVLLSSTGNIVKAARRFYVSTWRLTVSIEFPDSGFGYRSESVQTAATIRLDAGKPRFGVWPFGITYEHGAPAESGTDTPGARPYGDAARLVTGPVADELRRIVALLGKRTATVEILSDSPELHGPCWEAMLNGAAVDSVDTAPPASLEPSHLALRCRRARKVVTGRRSTPAGDVAIWAPKGTSQDLAREAWSRVKREIHFGESPGKNWEHRVGMADWFDQIASIADGAAPSNTRYTTCHAIGTVERTHGGLRLRPGPSTVAALDAASDGDSSEAMVRELPDLSLFILQATPLRSATPRLEDDRLAASLTRTFAAEIAAQSGAAVLVLPPMTLDIARSALRRMVSVLAEPSPNGTRALERCTAALRITVFAAFSAIEDADAARERAMDLCLFCEADWDGRSA